MKDSKKLIEHRYGKFGVLMGIGVAVLVHGLLFLIPGPEKAEPKKSEFTRGMKANAFRARNQVQERPVPRNDGGGSPARSSGQQSQTVAGMQEQMVSAGSSEAVFETAGGGGGTSSGVGQGDSASAPVTGSGVGQSVGIGGTGAAGVLGKGSGGSADVDAWKGLLSELEGKGSGGKGGKGVGKNWDSAGTGDGSGTGTGNGSGAGSGRGAYQKADADYEFDPNTLMDQRVRVNVVSYPSTKIENGFPVIHFPKMSVKRRELTKGICRVYYRVKVDEAGKIERRELKYPASAEEKKLYEAFVKAVTTEVDGWPFEKTAADIHVDVYFDLEEPE